MSEPRYDDEWDSCEECFATLRLLHAALDPDAVSVRLGLQPTRQWKRSDYRPPHIKAESSGWLITSKGVVNSRDIRRHIDWLLDRLAGREPVLRAMHLSGYHIDITCFWSSAWGHGGPALSVHQMRRLADLGIPIWFDVYFPEDDGEGGSPRTLN